MFRSYNYYLHYVTSKFLSLSISFFFNLCLKKKCVYIYKLLSLSLSLSLFLLIIIPTIVVGYNQSYIISLFCKLSRLSIHSSNVCLYIIHILHTLYTYRNMPYQIYLKTNVTTLLFSFFRKNYRAKRQKKKYKLQTITVKNRFYWQEFYLFMSLLQCFGGSISVSK